MSSMGWMPPLRSVHATALADELGNVVADELGVRISTRMRLLMLAKIAMHTGKIIEGCEQL